MSGVLKSSIDMIANMSPELRPGTYVFVSTSDPFLGASLASDALSVFREDEGLSCIVPIGTAEENGQRTDHPMRLITLNVFSALDGVGLTAAVAAALGNHGIPCNMVAAYHHDHVFVPADMADDALRILELLQAGRGSD